MAALAVFFAFSVAFAQVTITVNNVGYEKTGVKRAVVQSSGAISATTFDVINASGTAVATGLPLGEQTDVASWNGTGFRNFKVADFSSIVTDGNGYRVRVGTVTSPPFAIGEKLLQSRTGADQVAFFRGMRHTDAIDRNLPVFGSTRRHNIYGGWWDATGDAGKHLSHLSYANYYNPQQIPMVVWALLHAIEAQPEVFGASARAEAAWGADYLLRSLSPDDYFYMSVFSNWGDGYRWVEASRHGGGSRGEREICAWGNSTGITDSDMDATRNSDGIRSAAYQSAMREGAGVSIASLARAYKAGISGDSSAAQYLAGARRAYAHLKANPTRYQDNGRQNIIDYYCGLLAATELYNATDEAEYLAEAREWLDKLLGLQSADGWFYSGLNSGNERYRPFYHAAEEGLPVVAVSRFYQVAASNPEKLALREVVRRNLKHYVDITYKDANPFEYAKMYRQRSEPLGGGGPVDVGGAYTIHIEAEEWTSREGDFRETNGSIGWIEDGHSATYEFNADHADRYRLEFFVATGNQSSSFDVIVNGTRAGTLSFNNTGSWENFRIEALGGSGVQLTRGRNTIRLNFQNPVNVDYFRFVSNNVVIEPPSDRVAAFFIPKVNETGYWWQGENARLASMASAFILGAPIADHTGVMWADTLFGMATAQLDWILGRNPFNLTMMFGHGHGDGHEYPDYPGTQALPGEQSLANIKGGICNGISSARENENNIEWMPYSGENFWRNWRFVEQWLPHNAWYLIAVSSLSYRMDNPIEPEDVSVRPGASASKPARLRVSARGTNVRIELPFAADQRTEAILYNMQGRIVHRHAITQGTRTASIKLPGTTARGVYILSVRDISGKNKASERLNLR